MLIVERQLNCLNPNRDIKSLSGKETRNPIAYSLQHNRFHVFNGERGTNIVIRRSIGPAPQTGKTNPFSWSKKIVVENI